LFDRRIARPDVNPQSGTREGNFGTRRGMPSNFKIPWVERAVNDTRSTDDKSNLDRLP
jgi:hypothetical protein